MSKKFAYISFGILCLVVAHELGASRAQADWDSSVSGQIIGGGGLRWFDRAGRAWVPADGWSRDIEKDLPVLASEVKFMDADGAGHWLVLITHSDEAWAWSTNGDEWVYYGQYPGTPVSLDSESWTEIKGRYLD